MKGNSLECALSPCCHVLNLATLDPTHSPRQQGQKPSSGSPTPGRLQTFRNSRVWKAVTHGLEYDIHQVRYRCCSNYNQCQLHLVGQYLSPKQPGATGDSSGTA